MKMLKVKGASNGFGVYMDIGFNIFVFVFEYAIIFLITKNSKILNPEKF